MMLEHVQDSSMMREKKMRRKARWHEAKMPGNVHPDVPDR
jgi:hypothetical protein